MHFNVTENQLDHTLLQPVSSGCGAWKQKFDK